MDATVTANDELRIAYAFSPKDEAFATQLLVDLQQRLGSSVSVEHVPGESAPGEAPHWDEAQQLIQACQVFAVVLSPSALASPRINAEIDLAWRLRGPHRAIVPILYRESQVREDLETVQMSSFLPPKGYEQALSELVERFHAIRDLLRQQADQTATAPEKVKAPTPPPVAPKPAARPVLRPPTLSRAQRRALLVCGAVVLLLVSSLGLVNEVNYQVHLAHQRALATQTAIADAQWTQTIAAVSTQAVAHETVAAATQASANITATAQVYVPYTSKSPTCNDSYWQVIGGNHTCASDGVILSGPSTQNYPEIQFVGAHTLPFDYDMHVTITPLTANMGIYVGNNYYVIKGNAANGSFGIYSPSGPVSQDYGTFFPSSSYTIRYRYDGHKVAVYINGNLLYAQNVTITFPSIQGINISVYNLGLTGSCSAKVSNFSFVPIH